MANFDAAGGIGLDPLNSLLSQYYSSAEQAAPGNNPFDGTTTKNVPPLGDVTVTWKLKNAPVLAFGAPSQADWDASLDSAGNTNGADKKPLPTGPMAALTIPDMTASYTAPGIDPVGGETWNVVAYATLAFPAGEIDVTLVGLKIDESDFAPWDKAIFNTMLVPALFKAVTEMLGVIHVPALSWHGVSLNPLQIALSGNQLVAAATLTTNAAPLDTSGVAWPTDPVFVLASKPLIDSALAAGVQPYVGQTFSDSGNFKGLADWNYHGSLDSISATVGTLSPLTVNASITASLNVGGSLTPAGMALAAVGCAAGAALLAI
ncbi:MAG: hypothetical protein ACK4K7_10790 [Allosphingosinicella sp.]|uniref:hypothetical protein n=1 Tax=Allosphingosinicella sp. TaxID=2823234 RepID=UPI0039460655